MASLSNTGTSNMVAFGQYGSDHCVKDVEVQVPPGMEIVALQVVGTVPTSFQTLTGATGSSSFTDTGVTLPVGVTVYGRWSAAKVTNTDDMAVIAYFGPKPGGTQTF